MSSFLVNGRSLGDNVKAKVPGGDNKCSDVLAYTPLSKERVAVIRYDEAGYAVSLYAHFRRDDYLANTTTLSSYLKTHHEIFS
jgi:hypothetical protein